MENNFDIKKFLIENKLTRLSEQEEEWDFEAGEEWNKRDLRNLKFDLIGHNRQEIEDSYGNYGEMVDAYIVENVNIKFLEEELDIKFPDHVDEDFDFNTLDEDTKEKIIDLIRSEGDYYDNVDLNVPDYFDMDEWEGVSGEFDDYIGIKIK